MNKKLTPLLVEIVQNDVFHAKWLNTLSYLENCGARKIADCEHPTLVREEMLKHASEEFRHSHYLKKQMKKVSPYYFPDYCLPSILGGIRTLQYLKKLDLQTSRFLVKEHFLDKYDVKKVAYLLVTYSIERRAQKFYPLYERVLRNHRSNVYVKSIILEEEEHLNEMEKELQRLPMGMKYAEQACSFEHALFNKWIDCVKADLSHSWMQPIHAKFGSEDQAIIVYDVDILGFPKNLRAASLLSFKEGLISNIDLIYDTQSLAERK